MPNPRRRPTHRAPITIPIPNQIDKALLKRIAQKLLVSFKELPGFSNAIIGDIHNIYDLDGKNIAYYEFKFTSPLGKDNGYAILSATENDLPVVEFSHTGPTHYERFQAKLPGKKFKIIRFNVGYITAESSRRAILAEIGERPSLVPAELQVHMRGEGSDHRPPTRKRLTPRVDISRIRRRAELLDYETLKATYKRPKLRASDLRYNWKIVKSHHSPCTYKYYWADGYGQCTHFSQLPPNTPPNTNDHWSGCGPTAWMNLYGWHDRNWKASLLNGDQKYNNPYVKNLTMDVHDYIGTYEPWWTFGADPGFTWPSDMEKGLEFAKSRLLHDSSYWYRHDWAFTDEPWVFEVARDAARKKRPFIVGYYEDWHYTIGRGIAECSTHGWKKHSWIWLHSEDKWIPMGTIFGIYAVYDFFPLLVGAVGSEVKRYDWSSGWTTAEFYQTGGNTYLFLLKQIGGAVHIHQMNAKGTVGDRVDTRDWSTGWTQAQPFKVGNQLFLFLLKKGNGHVHIHKIITV